MLLSSLHSPKAGQTVRLKTDGQANQKIPETEVKTDVEVLGQ
jgi:hypothetical protein